MDPLNPNFCYGCTWWNYQCTAPKDEPCGNVIPDDIFIKTAHTRKDVDNAIRETFPDLNDKK